MSNSRLVSYTSISPNRNAPRNREVSKITIHHTAGIVSVETLGSIFAPVSRQASSNYGIGNDGRVGMYVEEKDRAWTSSSAANDNQAVTLEVSNDETGGDWSVGTAAYNALIKLCVDICRRNAGIKQKNGKSGLYFDGTPDGSLTIHSMFAATACPGPFLLGRVRQICNEVNNHLNNNIAVNETEIISAAKNNLLYMANNIIKDEKATLDSIEADIIYFLNRKLRASLF